MAIDRAIKVKWLSILIIVMFIYDLFITYIDAIRALLRNSFNLIPAFETLWPFAALSMALAAFWKIRRLDYIMIISGQIIMFIFFFESFSLPNNIIIGIQSVGFGLCLLASIRFAYFFFTKDFMTYIFDEIEKRSKLKNNLVVTDINIVENENGTFSVIDKSFSSRFDAEEYINLLKRTRA
jgi:hypothetical protein